MKKRTKIILIVLVASISFLSLSALVEFVAFSEYYDMVGPQRFFSPLKYEEIYSIYFKYDESWIIGKTPQEIMERYGEFDSGPIKTTNANGSPHYVLVDFWSVKYVMYIRFENNVAVEISRDDLW